MDEDFITNGLKSNRYLKADKLVQQFRSQIRGELEAVSEQIIEEHPELFEKDVHLDYEHFGIDNSRTITTIRIEFETTREHEEYGTRLLNLGLEWVEPGEQDYEDDLDGPLCYVLYKIQRGSEDRFTQVQHRTADREEWKQIRFGEDQWPYKRKESPGIVYIPVTDGTEIVDGLQSLQRHFSKEYAPLLQG
jgi:hypothetical protein